MNIATEIRSSIINAFEANKRIADRAVAQVADDKLHIALDANTNSIAVIMKHVAGNLTSLLTDFLTTDSENRRELRRGATLLIAPDDALSASRVEICSGLSLDPNLTLG